MEAGRAGLKCRPAVPSGPASATTAASARSWRYRASEMRRLSYPSQVGRGSSGLPGPVDLGVVGGAGGPAGPDDSDPGAGPDPVGVGVAFAAGPGVGVQATGPGRLHSGVVREGGDGLVGSSIGCPAEVHARGLPDDLVTGAAPHSIAACSAKSTRSRIRPNFGQQLGAVDGAHPGQLLQEQGAGVNRSETVPATCASKVPQSTVNSKLSLDPLTNGRAGLPKRFRPRGPSQRQLRAPQ